MSSQPLLLYSSYTPNTVSKRTKEFCCILLMCDLLHISTYFGEIEAYTFITLYEPEQI